MASCEVKEEGMKGVGESAAGMEPKKVDQFFFVRMVFCRVLSVVRPWGIGRGGFGRDKIPQTLCTRS